MAVSPLDMATYNNTNVGSSVLLADKDKDTVSVTYMMKMNHTLPDYVKNNPKKKSFPFFCEEL